MTVMPVALGVALVLTGLKFYAYWITGSSALLSDSLESIINLVAAGFSLFSVVLSAKPPDATHPYGHGKIEFFAAGFEGALIVLAAMAMFTKGIEHVLSPHALPHLETGLMILIVTGLVNLALATILMRTGIRTKSLVVEAHGRHVFTDVWSSAAVVLGLVSVHVTGWYQLDGGVACAVGVNMLFMAVAVVRRAFGGLMDESDPDLLREIGLLLQQHRKGLWIDAHRLRAWKSGQRIHLDFHLILPRDLPLEQGHREVKELELIFGEHFGGQAEILIHLDPCEDPECPVCGNDPCALRTEEISQTGTWHWRELTRDTPRTEKDP
jgi:cation diffusion facilitator family transporter